LPITAYIAHQCERVLEGYYNQNHWDFETNGEARIVAAVAEDRRDGNLVVLDVGAHGGDWTSAVLKARPDADVYCFEIVPGTRAALRDRFRAHANVRICEFGLSSAPGEVAVYREIPMDMTATISRRPSTSDAASMLCKVETGDAAVAQLALARIDLLKIDVEGHEVDVIRGFERTLGSDRLRPALVQFEYGSTFIPGRNTLQQVYELLGPKGYVIGRLYPDGVDFKPYLVADDHFRMGNYIAAQPGHPLARRLAKF
jgi:FkbM family methyltransferase